MQAPLFSSREVKRMEQISDGELDVIMDVAKYRAGLLDELEEALRADDDERIKKIGRLLCGIDEKGNRI